MINAFEICVNLFEEFVTALFITLYLGSKYNDWRKYAGVVCITIFSASVTTFFNSLYLNEGFLGLTYIAIYVIYACIFLKGNIYIKLFIAGFINCIVYFIAFFSALIVSIIVQYDYNKMYSMTSERVFLIIISKILLLSACIILLKFKLKISNAAKQRNMLLLILMPVVSQMSIVGMSEVFFQFHELSKELLLTSMGIMLANVLTYYVFIKINNDIKKEAEYIALQQKYEYDRQHAKDIEELYSKTCGIRHDLLHHFTTLKGLLDDGLAKAQEYIDSVTEHQLDEIKHFVNTDSECFDAIVNAKIAICESLGIDVQIRVMNKSLYKLKNDEIGILFGNLFDNAIEASKNSSKKTIELDVCMRDANLSILMANSIDASVLENNENLRTTKDNEEYHGFGTKNIKRIIDEYDGIISYYEENGYFICDILL